MSASQEFIRRAIRAGRTYDELPPRIRAAVTPQEWKTSVLEQCIIAGRAYAPGPAAAVCDDQEYCEALIEAYGTWMRVYPYHLSDTLCRVMRLPPRRYYQDMLARLIRDGGSYDRLPNFTAADALRVLGIGRNEFIATAQAFKARRSIWRLGRGTAAARELLPQQSAATSLRARPWWRARVVNLAEQEYRELSDAELLTLKAACRAPEGTPVADLDPVTLRELLRADLVYMHVPVDPTDRFEIPPLEGFVSNRTAEAGDSGADPVEALLYKVFVANSASLCVADLAAILAVDVADLCQALSVACRLGFAAKINPPLTPSPSLSPSGNGVSVARGVTPLPLANDLPPRARTAGAVEGITTANPSSSYSVGDLSRTNSGTTSMSYQLQYSVRPGPHRSPSRGVDSLSQPFVNGRGRPSAATRLSEQSSFTTAGRLSGGSSVASTSAEWNAQGLELAVESDGNQPETRPLHFVPGDVGASSAPFSPLRSPELPSLFPADGFDPFAALAAAGTTRPAEEFRLEADGGASFSSSSAPANPLSALPGRAGLGQGAGVDAVPALLGGFLREEGAKGGSGSGAAADQAAEGTIHDPWAMSIHTRTSIMGSQPLVGQLTNQCKLDLGSRVGGYSLPSPSLATDLSLTQLFQMAPDSSVFCPPPPPGGREGNVSYEQEQQLQVNLNLDPFALLAGSKVDSGVAATGNSSVVAASGATVLPRVSSPQGVAALKKEAAGGVGGAGYASSSAVAAIAAAAVAEEVRGATVAVVVDAETTGYLMMGALSPGLKRHAVTLFEGGRVTGRAAIQEMSGELWASYAVAATQMGFEGEGLMQLAQCAAALAAVLDTARDVGGVARSDVENDVELIRRESLVTLPPAAVRKIFLRSYDAVLSITSLPLPPLPLSPLDGIGDVSYSRQEGVQAAAAAPADASSASGPGESSAGSSSSSGRCTAFYGASSLSLSPWLSLSLCSKARRGLTTLVLAAGQRLSRLPAPLDLATHALVTPWNPALLGQARSGSSGSQSNGYNSAGNSAAWGGPDLSRFQRVAVAIGDRGASFVEARMLLFYLNEMLTWTAVTVQPLDVSSWTGTARLAVVDIPLPLPSACLRADSAPDQILNPGRPFRDSKFGSRRTVGSARGGRQDPVLGRRERRGLSPARDGADSADVEGDSGDKTHEADDSSFSSEDDDSEEEANYTDEENDSGVIVTGICRGFVSLPLHPPTSKKQQQPPTVEPNRPQSQASTSSVNTSRAEGGGPSSSSGGGSAAAENPSDDEFDEHAVDGDDDDESDVDAADASDGDKAISVFLDPEFIRALDRLGLSASVGFVRVLRLAPRREIWRLHRGYQRQIHREQQQKQQQQQHQGHRQGQTNTPVERGQREEPALTKGDKEACIGVGGGGGAPRWSPFGKDAASIRRSVSGAELDRDMPLQASCAPVLLASPAPRRPERYPHRRLRSDPSSWLPLSLQLGLPLNCLPLCKLVCQAAVDTGFLSPEGRRRQYRQQIRLHRKLASLACRFSLQPRLKWVSASETDADVGGVSSTAGCGLTGRALSFRSRTYDEGPGKVFPTAGVEGSVVVAWEHPERAIRAGVLTPDGQYLPPYPDFNIIFDGSSLYPVDLGDFIQGGEFMGLGAGVSDGVRVLAGTYA